jgi:hypothetical protein
MSSEYEGAAGTEKKRKDDPLKEYRENMFGLASNVRVISGSSSTTKIPLLELWLANASSLLSTSDIIRKYCNVTLVGPVILINKFSVDPQEPISF